MMQDIGDINSNGVFRDIEFFGDLMIGEASQETGMHVLKSGWQLLDQVSHVLSRPLPASLRLVGIDEDLRGASGQNRFPVHRAYDRRGDVLDGFILCDETAHLLVKGFVQRIVVTKSGEHDDGDSRALLMYDPHGRGAIDEGGIGASFIC